MAARKTHRAEHAGGGMPLAANFALTMSLALALVSTASSYFLFSRSRDILGGAQQEALIEAVRLSAGPVSQETDLQRLRGERDVFDWVEKKIARTIEEAPKPDGGSSELAALEKLHKAMVAERDKRARQHENVAREDLWRPLGGEPEVFGDGRVSRARVEYGTLRKATGAVYSYKLDNQPPFNLLIPDTMGDSESRLFGLFVGATFAIIVVGAIVSAWVASRVSSPVQQLVEDVRHIATGDLRHRTRARGSGEIDLLARSIDRMATSLAEARENEVELQVRTREVEVATEIRTQLLPQSTPKLEGYQIGQLHLASSSLGGDFHDMIDTGGAASPGVGLLVCEISGRGVPAALVGATARSYLRAMLMGGGDVGQSLRDVNRELARDVRRGIAVTAIYARVDATQGIATVACTGHKVPLIRYTGADKKVRIVHPEGIALGFDKGPVFDGKLEIAKSPIDPGDRLVLVNSGAVTIANGEGAELGEKALYALVMRFGALPTEQFLAKLREALESHRGDAPLARDVSIVTISRA